MTGPEQERWLGPVWRDGRWWVVRDDADQVGWADHVRWHRGWPPGRRHRLTGLLVVVLVALPFLVLGGGILSGQLCAIPECGYGELVAVQARATTGQLPVVHAAPCSRAPVDAVTVTEAPALGSNQGREVWRLVREPGTGVVTRLPLGEPVPGYREAAGRPVEELQAAYRARLADPPVLHLVTITYADGSADTAALGYRQDTTGLSLHTWGDQTLEQFRADATASPVCLPWILEVGHALPLSVAGWAAVLLALAVRAVRRGRYADELVRAARAGHP